VRSLVDHRRGKYSRARLARRGDSDLAIDATLRAAATRAARAGSGLAVSGDDLRRKVREHRSPLAIVFVVDNSYSVHAERMVEKIKGLTLGLLEDAASRGDRVSLVAFKSGLPEATVALPLTRSRSRAAARLEAIPLSGRTPLPDALRRAGRVLRQETTRHRNAIPLVVCVTDGVPTAPLAGGSDPLEDTLAEAAALRRAHVRVLVADTSGAGAARGAGGEIAAAAGGRCVPFRDLTVALLEEEATHIGAARSAT
jgi:Mg-chelatase subunit ChlD